MAVSGQIPSEGLKGLTSRAARWKVTGLYLRRALASVSAGWLCLATSYGWQNASQKVTVTVGDAMAPPEWIVRVPVSLGLAEGAQIGQLTMELTYPSKVLSYVRFEPDEALKSAGAEVTVEAPQAPDEQRGMVVVKATASKDKGKPIPPGILLYLVFQVASGAEPGPLTLETRKARVEGWSPDQKVSLSEVKPATLTVAPGGLPALGCFFYMH